MNRIVSLLLIPFFVLGQALPHSHAGSGVAEPAGHALRPHVHLHSHDYGDHHHPSSERNKTPLGDEVSPAADHDSDAVYLAASMQWARTYPSIAIDVLVKEWVGYPIYVVVEKQCICRNGDPPDQYARLPIYLLKASLLL